MIYDPIGYQAVWFPALYRTAGTTSTLRLLRYIAVRLDALFGLPWQLKFFSSRHGCSHCPPPLPHPWSPFLSRSLRSRPQLSLPRRPLSFSLSLLASPLVISRCPTRYAPAIKSARSPRTFTRSLTPGSAGVKGTDVLA